jgi:DNA (cytosine-5)-methyltransferase 1
MRYLSVCSGIEAASVAWAPLGWSPFAFSENEAFPSAVLSHHYGSNLHNEKWSHNAPPNLGDMKNFRGWPNATINLLVGGTPCQSFSVAGLRAGLADPRGNLCLTFLAIAERYRPRWLLWENVPGVLSSNAGRDFGAFLGGLGQLGYGWAYRVLDAQYVRVDGFARAVPQRRRRVFVVGYLGDWRRAAAVLFESESMRWHPAPRRKTGQTASPTLAARTRGGGGLGTDFDCDGGLISHTLNAKGGTGRIDGESETFVAHALRADGFDASEDGTGRGTPLVPISFSAKDHGGDAEIDLSPTLRAGGFTSSHANAGVMPAVAYGIRSDAAREGQAKTPSPDASGHVRLRDPGFNVYEQLSPTLDGTAPHNIATAVAVRRLMPIECERLQGFPDNYTLIPYRGRAAADGPRYKALGNSMAVNVMRWIGRRIEQINTFANAA